MNLSYLIENEFIVIALTLGIFFSAQLLQKKINSVLLNPILVSVVVLICILKLSKINYEAYENGSKYISFLLKPAVVALGVPLYLQLEKIKKQSFNILLSQLVGCIIGVLSVVFIAKWMNTPREIILSIAPKSVTAPIAIEISKTINGIPSLTAPVVISIGIFGAVFGYLILELFRVKNPISQSLAIGNVSHGIGTSKSMGISQKYGAMSSVGMILNGVLTAVLAPYIIEFIELWINL